MLKTKLTLMKIFKIKNDQLKNTTSKGKVGISPATNFIYIYMNKLIKTNMLQKFK